RQATAARKYVERVLVGFQIKNRCYKGSPLSGMFAKIGRITMDNLEIELMPFMKKPVLFGIRFKPSGYDVVFRLCVNHLIASFNALKTKNFEIAYRPGEPSAEFYKSVDMLSFLLKSIHRVPRIPWK